MSFNQCTVTVSPSNSISPILLMLTLYSTNSLLFGHISCPIVFYPVLVFIFSASGQSGNYMYPPTMAYYNQPVAGSGGMFFSPFSTAPMFYSAPILPPDEGTLQEYIKKQM